MKDAWCDVYVCSKLRISLFINQVNKLLGTENSDATSNFMNFLLLFPEFQSIYVK